MKNNCQVGRGANQSMYWQPFVHPDDDMYCYDNYNCTHQIKEKFGNINNIKINHLLAVAILLAMVYLWNART